MQRCAAAAPAAGGSSLAWGVLHLRQAKAPDERIVGQRLDEQDGDGGEEVGQVEVEEDVRPVHAAQVIKQRGDCGPGELEGRLGLEQDGVGVGIVRSWG